MFSPSSVNVSTYYASMAVSLKNKLKHILVQGIIDIYVSHAENHISKHVENDTVRDISRKQVELDVLQVLDKNKFPIEMKLSWYHAVCNSFIPIAPCSRPITTYKTHFLHYHLIRPFQGSTRPLTVPRSCTPLSSNRSGTERLCDTKSQRPISFVTLLMSLNKTSKYPLAWSRLFKVHHLLSRRDPEVLVRIIRPAPPRSTRAQVSE